MAKENKNIQTTGYLHPSYQDSGYFDPRATKMLNSALKPVQATAWEGKNVSHSLNATSKVNNSLQSNGWLHPSLSDNGYFDPRVTTMLKSVPKTVQTEAWDGKNVNVGQSR